jgi:hypothetical protein
MIARDARTALDVASHRQAVLSAANYRHTAVNNKAGCRRKEPSGGRS